MSNRSESNELLEDALAIIARQAENHKKAEMLIELAKVKATLALAESIASLQRIRVI